LKSRRDRHLSAAAKAKAVHQRGESWRLIGGGEGWRSGESGSARRHAGILAALKWQRWLAKIWQLACISVSVAQWRISI